jgi:hypothetical protein
MHKTYHFVCFFNVLANVHILPRHFLPVFVMEWCLRSADALGPCNWPVFFWGSQNLVDLGTFKKKISEIWPCLLYFKNIWKFYVFGGRKRPVGTWWVNWTVSWDLFNTTAVTFLTQIQFAFCPICWLLASNVQNVDDLNGTYCEAKSFKNRFKNRFIISCLCCCTYQAVVTVKVKVGLPCPQLLLHLVWNQPKSLTKHKADELQNRSTNQLMICGKVK